ncbi:sigma-70 family RNA polymerase sigma factor [Massilia atriviolacea]|uniref:Sigma-70 family RNA polymerase sigma factor n=1 Tax=Massilia atriviolacea TaxID=2495579 RepID=A0A430HFN1_9BURK|nr:sigma-70 family RNA polymerase sigma factor [Massilia atriviolacea]RSZ56384.1 sigma-70 family RNA polymerase sigma factor [Massilia atriviolacea]
MRTSTPQGASGAATPPALADEPALWKAARGGGAAARARLIEGYLPFVRMLAAKMFAGRIDHDLEFNEYLQFGTIGLIEAVDRFDPAMGNQFKTFAGHRINGAILDGIGQMSEKRTQVNTRKRQQAERRDAARVALDSGTRDLFQQLADVAIGLALGYVLDDPVVYDHQDASVADQHYTRVEMAQLRSKMQALVATLPEKERMVIKYHYLNQVSFAVIAETMNLSKGRVSQLHNQALALLRRAANAVSACDVAW